MGTRRIGSSEIGKHLQRTSTKNTPLPMSVWINTVSIISLCCVCLSLNACRLAHVLSTQYSENIARASYGTEANHPGLIDGKTETVATLPAANVRNFIIRFADVHPVRKIVVHNGNLFRFEMEYLNPDTGKWQEFENVIQRRNLEGKRAQPIFEFDRLNFKTQMIRINVSRTVDDIIVNKFTRDPGDKIVNQRRELAGRYQPHFRVVRPSVAQVREIEVYHLAQKK
ncbi:hypothetical protein F4X73_13900 [Candidatus Poribacteria bacterium]|nr:hypothetical protein [Candidatus Poribacteria bacterium]MYB65779.1 hypothetical protein [Candidatus Poribacteria bacterium]MYF55938.1 hypothetical protein [Candidatus Poribacteria bacterium]